MIFNKKNNDEVDSFAGKVANIARRVGEKLQDFRKQLKQVGFSVSLDELQENYAPVLDMLILREEETGNCHYIGGEFRIALSDEGHYDCAYDFYFEDEDGSFHELSAQTEPLPLDGITADFRKELEDEKVLCFELGEPSEDSRRKYQEQKEKAAKETKETNVAKSEPQIDVTKEK